MMMDIPHSIDEQHNLFWWDMDEVILIGASVGMGVVLKTWFMMLLGFSLVWLFTRYKSAAFRGVLMHMAYWYGLFELNKWFKNGLTREWMD